ncbi:hypothetical protein BGZ99_007409 [Dissophora globulifera]|uniref:Uncharacterized protein n=1 Tax=Dissophora globulifera TaxID=979702 RepID=A0A9P6RED9_9FUNG|nr:hypothetical protein BGZ99_007409 [Dissophora globulifera]
MLPAQQITSPNQHSHRELIWIKPRRLMLRHRFFILARQLASVPTSSPVSVLSRTTRTPSAFIAAAHSRRVASRMSSSTSQQQQQQQQEQAQQEQQKQQRQNEEKEDVGSDSHNKPLLTLPAPGDVSSQQPAQQLEVNGTDLKLDILGPVVVNEDGTISRIDNWSEMADIEKANVRRILLKRNAQRLARLRTAQQQEAGGDS